MNPPSPSPIILSLVPLDFLLQTTCLNYLVRYWFPSKSNQGFREVDKLWVGIWGSGGGGGVSGWRSEEGMVWTPLLTVHSDPTSLQA